MNFFHDHLRQAVQTKYLPTAEEQKKVYLKLADYFQSKPVDNRVVCSDMIGTYICVCVVEIAMETL